MQCQSHVKRTQKHTAIQRTKLNYFCTKSNVIMFWRGLWTIISYLLYKVCRNKVYMIMVMVHPKKDLVCSCSFKTTLISNSFIVLCKCCFLTFYIQFHIVIIKQIELYLYLNINGSCWLLCCFCQNNYLMWNWQCKGLYINVHLNICLHCTFVKDEQCMGNKGSRRLRGYKMGRDQRGNNWRREGRWVSRSGGNMSWLNEWTIRRPAGWLVMWSMTSAAE